MSRSGQGDLPPHEDIDCDLGVMYEGTGVRWCNFHTIEHQMLRLADQRNAVLALHARRPRVMSDPMTHDDTQSSDVCDHCRSAYPCLTVKALAGEGDAS